MVKGDKMSKEAIKISTLIGAGSVCDGDFKCPGSARIDGTINGNVEIDGVLVLGAVGKINGDILAKAVQIGGEVNFSTEYDAFGYSPATSIYYPVLKKEVTETTPETEAAKPAFKKYNPGNYPLLNGFANIKIRGVLMFFKWENICNGWMRDWYYSTDNYPYQDFHFMFGILWRFGD